MTAEVTPTHAEEQPMTEHCDLLELRDRRHARRWRRGVPR
jgi:hypothetical protein